MARPPTLHSAIFLSHEATYHADRCEPLVAAVARGEVRLEALARRGYPGRAMPARLLPEISTVGYWDARIDQAWGLDWHRNEGIELTFLSRGRLEFGVDGKAYPLGSGALTITRPWQQHRVGGPHVHASRLHWLILDVGVRRPNQDWKWPAWLILAPADLRRLTELLRHNEQPVWPANAELASRFEQIAGLVAQPDPLAVQTRLQLCLNELFVVLLELLESKRTVLDQRLSSTQRTVELFLRSLPGHLDHPWTLEEMAAQCGLGRTRFAAYCRQIVNVSPMDYLAQCRVEAAQRLLRSDPHRSLTDVAFACGFQSSQYFSTVFRERTGVCPRDFRQQRQRVVAPARSG